MRKLFPDFSDLLRVAFWMEGDQQKHFVAVHWPGDERMLREPRPQIAWEVAHECRSPPSGLLNRIARLGQRTELGGGPYELGRIDAAAAVHGQVPKARLASRVGVGSFSRLGLLKPGQQACLCKRDVLDAIDNRPGVTQRAKARRFFIHSGERVCEHIDSVLKHTFDFDFGIADQAILRNRIIIHRVRRTVIRTVRQRMGDTTNVEP
jgi:hypothetical protein